MFFSVWHWNNDPCFTSRVDLILPKKAFGQLTKTIRRAHLTPVFNSLCLFSVCFRIDFESFRIYLDNIILLVFKSLHDCAPQYMTDMQNVPSRSHSSSGTSLLTIPKPWTKRQTLVTMPSAPGTACQRTWVFKLWNFGHFLKEIFNTFLSLFFHRVLLVF